MTRLTEELIDELNEELDKMTSCFFFVLASQDVAMSMLKDTTWLDSYQIHIDLTMVKFIDEWFLKRGLAIQWNNSRSNFWIA